MIEAATSGGHRRRHAESYDFAHDVEPVAAQVRFAADQRDALDVEVSIDADPAVVNRDPYADGWMVKERLSDAGAVASLRWQMWRLERQA